MKVIAVFDDSFKSVKFVVQETWEEIDARAVLTNLAHEKVKVTYTAENHESGLLISETWEIEGKSP